ncbi:hypothetical protein ABEB36_014218 [Hypothenemus hampei]|uniref:Gustatory receptor n=1 Tax=Hypothenemus hampei TaxID=57062 RepID=A0ABD1E4M4_HYPHA
MASNCASLIVSGLNIFFILLPSTKGTLPKSHFLVQKVSCWSFLLITVVMAPLTILIKDDIFCKVPLIHRVVYDCSVMVLFATNIYLSFLSIYKMKELAKLLQHISKNIYMSTDFLMHFSIFVLLHLVNTLLILCNQLQRTQDLRYQLTTIFVDGYLTFRLILALFMIFLMLSDIRKKWQNLNGNLTKQETVQKFQYHHNQLCDYVMHLNVLFGMVFLLIIFYFITASLRHAVFVSVSTQTSVTTVRCLWIVSYTLQIAYLANAGEKITSEAQCTVAICYKRLSKVRHEKWVWLAQQAYMRTPKISAAGFFNVDNSMILFMATTFLTYFIVVVQLLVK